MTEKTYQMIIYFVSNHGEIFEYMDRIRNSRDVGERVRRSAERAIVELRALDLELSLILGDKESAPNQG